MVQKYATYSEPTQSERTNDIRILKIKIPILLTPFRRPTAHFLWASLKTKAPMIR
ncbi:uncharacterized protein STEHIDRAFT_117976 [Stereum hirsutum FP-91666 SS1]|uniref:uncharacterized protein n=1 Tax=Stereum hirsutum (strain FP-91666) TaxID=721885 RepID=UPI0004410308|nr:uncharacterized protein STEHIDRAFT_117976 [Stereum hirsutum FP-91666 SS1]EIM90692.1 hypothetical protein STEHIDRAFT_117976 [Stereum hirsutum FP-91666 SS1]